MSNTIHLIIPDVPLREAIAEQLTLAGFGEVTVAATLADAVKAEPAAIVIDESAHGKKPMPVLSACVLLLGAAPEEESEGITESFAKPLRLGHLIARLRYYLEVAPRLRGTPLAFGPFRLEAQQRRLVVAENDSVIRLTEKETALLEYIAQSPAPVPRGELLAAIWGYDARIDTHTLETHIHQLRRKLDPDGRGTEILVNEQGAYRLK